jgi:hypothetical protein
LLSQLLQELTKIIKTLKINDFFVWYPNHKPIRNSAKFSAITDLTDAMVQLTIIQLVA